MSESIMKLAYAHMHRNWRTYSFIFPIIITAFILGSPFNLIFIAFSLLNILIRGTLWVILYNETFDLTLNSLRARANCRTCSGIIFLVTGAHGELRGTLALIIKFFDELTTKQRTRVFVTIVIIYLVWFVLGNGVATMVYLFAIPVLSYGILEERKAIALGGFIAAAGGVVWTWVQITLGFVFRNALTSSQLPSFWSSLVVKIIQLLNSEISIIDQVVRLVQTHPCNLEVEEDSKLTGNPTMNSPLGRSMLIWGRTVMFSREIPDSLPSFEGGSFAKKKTIKPTRKGLISTTEPASLVPEASVAVGMATFDRDPQLLNQDGPTARIIPGNLESLRGASNQKQYGLWVLCENQAEAKAGPEKAGDIRQQRQRARAYASELFACVATQRVRVIDEYESNMHIGVPVVYETSQTVEFQGSVAGIRDPVGVMQNSITAMIETVSAYPYDSTFHPITKTSTPVYNLGKNSPIFYFEDFFTISTKAEDISIETMGEAIEILEAIMWKPTAQPVTSTVYCSTYWLSTAFATLLVAVWLCAVSSFIQTALCKIRGRQPRPFAAMFPWDVWASLILMISVVIVLVILPGIMEFEYSIRGDLYLQVFSILAMFKSLKIVLDVFYHLFPEGMQSSESTLFPEDVTVIISTGTSNFCSNSRIKRALQSILSNQPRRIIVSTVGLVNYQEAFRFCLQLSTSTTSIELVSTAPPSQQYQSINALDNIQTPIICYANDDVIWPTAFLRCALQAFEDDRVGIVETVQRGVRVRGLPMRRSWGNFIQCMGIERRNWEKTASWKLNSGVGMIYGKSTCIRTDIINSLEYRDRMPNRRPNRRQNRKVLRGDVGFTTRFCVERGWETAFLKQREAMIYVDLWCSNASTNTIMSSTPSTRIKSLRSPSSGLTYRIWWFISDIFIPFLFKFPLFYDLILLFTLYKATGAEYLCSLATLLIIGRFLKSLEYLYREPRDIAFVLVHVLLEYLYGFVRL